LPVVLSDDVPAGHLGIVFGSVDESAAAIRGALLYDPDSVITQLKLATT
jgi:hypothetical protein